MFKDLLYISPAHQYLKVLLALLMTFALYSPSISFATNSSNLALSQFVISNSYQQNTSHTVTIDSVTVRTDSTFQLALQASDLTGADISSFDIVLSYDASLITATGATLDGTLSGSGGAGMTLVSNTDTPGAISIAAAGAEVITGSGDLVILTFQSLSSQGTSSISFTQLSFNEGAPEVNGTTGAVTVEALLIGDPSLNREITAYDASLVLQHVVGNSTLTGESITAAEASGNGEVSAYDASMILRYTTGMITCFPAESSCSASKQSSKANARLSWHTDASAKTSLLIDDHQGSIQAVTIDLQLNEADINELTSLTPEGWTLTSSQFNDSTYRILLIGTTPLQSDSLIALRINDKTHDLKASYQLNEEAALSINFSTGSIEKTETPSSYALHQNYPNPFNPSTTIQYALPQESRVTLTIYNLLGREVARLVDKVQKAGTHSLSFNATNLASGTYIYRIETPEYTATRQMLLIK